MADNKNTIVINGVSYKLVYNLRSMLYYEALRGEPFTPDKLLNEISLYFTIILANNPDFSMSIDEFIDCLDNNLISLLRNWLIEDQQKDPVFSSTEEKKNDHKKKE